MHEYSSPHLTTTARGAGQIIGKDSHWATYCLGFGGVIRIQYERPYLAAYVLVMDQGTLGAPQRMTDRYLKVGGSEDIP